MDHITLAIQSLRENDKIKSKEHTLAALSEKVRSKLEEKKIAAADTIFRK